MLIYHLSVAYLFCSVYRFLHPHHSSSIMCFYFCHLFLSLITSTSVKMGLEVAESLPAGSGEDWLCWRALNRLHTGVGRAKTVMRWGYLDDAQSVDCDCGEPQTMAHLLSCRLLDEACTADDLATVTERAKACARKWEKIVWRTRKKKITSTIFIGDTITTIACLFNYKCLMFKATLIVVWQPSGYMVRAFHWQYGDILLAIYFFLYLLLCTVSEK